MFVVEVCHHLSHLYISIYSFWCLVVIIFIKLLTRPYIKHFIHFLFGLLHQLLYLSIQQLRLSSSHSYFFFHILLNNFLIFSPLPFYSLHYIICSPCTSLSLDSSELYTQPLLLLLYSALMNTLNTSLTLSFSLAVIQVSLSFLCTFLFFLRHASP